MIPVAVTCAEPVSMTVLAEHDVFPTNTVPTGEFGAEVRAEPDTTGADDESIPGGQAGPSCVRPGPWHRSRRRPW